MRPDAMMEKQIITVTLKGGKKFLSSSTSSNVDGYMMTRKRIRTIDIDIPEKKKTIHESLKFIFYWKPSSSLLATLISPFVKLVA